MNAALVLEGGPKIPDGSKLQAHKISRLYYEGRDPQISQSFFDWLRSLHYEVGVDYDPEWDGYPAPAVGARALSDMITDLASPSFGRNVKQCAAMLDAEHHDPKYVLETIKAFRRLRNLRELVWTMEGHQGGWIKTCPELVDLINRDPNLRVSPQAYDKNMADWAPDEMVQDLIRAGIKPQKIDVFLGLRTRKPLPWWKGILYLENWGQL